MRQPCLEEVVPNRSHLAINCWPSERRCSPFPGLGAVPGFGQSGPYQPMSSLPTRNGLVWDKAVRPLPGRGPIIAARPRFGSIQLPRPTVLASDVARRWPTFVSLTTIHQQIHVGLRGVYVHQEPFDNAVIFVEQLDFVPVTHGTQADIRAAGAIADA